MRSVSLLALVGFFLCDPWASWTSALGLAGFGTAIFPTFLSGFFEDLSEFFEIQSDPPPALVFGILIDFLLQFRAVPRIHSSSLGSLCDSRCFYEPPPIKRHSFCEIFKNPLFSFNQCSQLEFFPRNRDGVTFYLPPSSPWGPGENSYGWVRCRPFLLVCGS